MPPRSETTAVVDGEVDRSWIAYNRQVEDHNKATACKRLKHHAWAVRRLKVQDKTDHGE
jgi:hypothetical protein